MRDIATEPTAARFSQLHNFWAVALRMGSILRQAYINPLKNRDFLESRVGMNLG